MNKRMLSILGIAILLLIPLGGCVASNEGNIIGNWRTKNDDIYIFYSNNTYYHYSAPTYYLSAETTTGYYNYQFDDEFRVGYILIYTDKYWHNAGIYEHKLQVEWKDGNTFTLGTDTDDNPIVWKRC